ncbi:hypothetical protein ABOONEI_2993 [Aciduliprofundum boonei T469]|nr:hypothetical protein ABOONEI_3 [Aciduliprofundum boonei T469]EDY34919.1 hypothetical protein ABOONEI_1185 [Aciduliprofundum boonei T469]EDY36032.1 hypothetical protein ABOONEI_2993 [Aciduliprofundum boonei T469]
MRAFFTFTGVIIPPSRRNFNIGQIFLQRGQNMDVFESS